MALGLWWKRDKLGQSLKMNGALEGDDFPFRFEAWHILGDRLIPLAPLILVGFYM